MDAHFERTKNLKALGLTVIISIAILFALFFISWTLPQITLPKMEEGIEVNLGNSDEGLGDIAPSVPGDPSLVAEEANANPTPTAEAAASENNNHIAEDDVVDATPVNMSKSENKTKTIPNNTTTAKKTNTNPAVNTTPAPLIPKAVYNGGTKNGSGGNNGDSYNNTRNQGVAGGNGDQGKANGNPNSDSYTGNGGTGKSGVSIKSGLQGRRFTKLPSFTDDFNENAKVAVDIKVDKNGNVTSALVNPRGTTTTNMGIRSIAVRKALQLKLNAGSADEQTGTIVFDFKLRG